MIPIIGYQIVIDQSMRVEVKKMQRTTIPHLKYPAPDDLPRSVL